MADNEFRKLAGLAPSRPSLAEAVEQTEARKQVIAAKVSPRHKWDKGYPVTHCERCGSYFSYNGMDANGPYHCQPTPAWLKAHPDDDGKTR